MDLRSLTRKQKRLKDWTNFLEQEVVDDATRVSLTNELKNYRNLLAKVWEEERVSEEDEASIDDLERRIEQLADDARLLAR